MKRTRPLLIYDGDCGFCKHWILRWKFSTGTRVDYAPYQEVGKEYPSIRPSQFEQAVHLVEPSGQVTRGAHAVFRSLTYGAHKLWARAALWAYTHIPGVRPVTEGAYRLVAQHRVFFSRITYALMGYNALPSTYALTTWLFLRAFGLVYLAAFLSLWSQISGLVGSQGILASDWSDSSIQGLCLTGALASILLVADIVPALMAGVAWLIYTQLAALGGPFLGFQWDALLLEAGLYVILLAPWTLRPRVPSRLGIESTPPPAALWLLRLLLFRVVFFSGYVKLASGDAVWRDLTALRYHFETQPLPTVVGYFFHHFPPGLLKALAAALFVLELVVPFLYFLPRRARLLGFFATAVFQLLIDLTGNYGFFGLNVIALSVLLLDDAYLSRLFSTKTAKAASSRPLLFKVRAGVSLAVGVLVVWGLLFREGTLDRWLRTHHLANGYGVFAVMTQTRNEVVLEGSADGITWKEYGLPWKPGDVRRSPPFAGPHMPRLDWQLWFAALGPHTSSPWLMPLMQRLLEGSAPVQRLFEVNPFPDQPPRFVRAILYEYRFARTGSWWSRTALGQFTPQLSLK
jgi:lipase maturation factor 1